VNINREPYSNPHAIRAITKKNISFAYFIGLNTTTLNKLDGIPYTTVYIDIKKGGGSVILNTDFVASAKQRTNKKTTQRWFWWFLAARAKSSRA
jgi:hypothetical protein